jgi:hypothetical protein
VKHPIDPVLNDDAKRDRREETLTAAYEKALSMATAAYNRGEFDDEIQDKCDPSDVTKIALAVLQELDNQRGVRLPLPTYWLRHVSCQMRDLRATVDGVLERHAQEILEHD